MHLWGDRKWFQLLKEIDIICLLCFTVSLTTSSLSSLHGLRKNYVLSQWQQNSPKNNSCTACNIRREAMCWKTLTSVQNHFSHTENPQEMTKELLKNLTDVQNCHCVVTDKIFWFHCYCYYWKILRPVKHLTCCVPAGKTESPQLTVHHPTNPTLLCYNVSWCVTCHHSIVAQCERLPDSHCSKTILHF